MTAPETVREIPSDELVERLRIRAAQHRAGWRGLTYGQAEAMDDEAAADLIEAQAARIAFLEATGCMCRDVPIGSHKVSVLMDLPEHMADVQDARVLAGLSPQITVDACLVEEVRDLWSRGIRTTGCCCGHNRAIGYIGVDAGDIPTMKAMGYVVRENSSRPGDEDSFVPKSVRLSASLETERARTVDGLAERLRQQVANADDDIADALADAETTGDVVGPDDWHVEVPVNWLRECIAALASEKGGQADDAP